MASPQTHGLISLTLLIIFLFLVSLGIAGKITFWEYVSVIIWGVVIDFDHLLIKKYWKDLGDRVFRRGGGRPSKEAQGIVCWLHIWPGFILVWLWGISFHHFIEPSFRVYFPFTFWLIHVIIDRYQEAPLYDPQPHFLYPFVKKKLSHRGYPAKPASEFIINSCLWMIAALVLLGLLLFK